MLRTQTPAQRKELKMKKPDPFAKGKMAPAFTKGGMKAVEKGEGKPNPFAKMKGKMPKKEK